MSEVQRLPPAESTMMGPLTHGDYTIGWICALPETELVAAAAMLDAEHPKLPADPKDTNTYLLGRVGHHNVVIACLPAETTGKVSAAAVAKDLLRSFPAVRLGLMVGVGGGAPYYGSHGDGGDTDDAGGDSEDDEEVIQDIRLGDVVVSLHSQTTEAVVQYDFGKSLQGKEFVRCGGALNKPPHIALNAISVLRQQHRRRGHRILELLDETIANNPGMAGDFQHPGTTRDRLFKPNATHVEGKKSCRTCGGPDNINLVERPERASSVPRLHYGTIGSADQVMKDAILRDKWARKEGIKCFEMEAAGLMDFFPCLVIRGICDYADSHKNKKWQPYAAVTAAAYAKELLLIIPGQDVIHLLPIKQLLDTVCRTETKVDTIRSRLNRQDGYAILDWITPVDYGPQQSDYLRRRHAGTGQWLLRSAEFQAWVQTKQKTLFCRGVPGAGKTVLTSMVIDELTKLTWEDACVGTAYIYCNYQRRDDQTSDSLLCSLLKQLAEQLPSLPPEVRNLYEEHRTRRTRPLCEDILTALHSVATQYSRVYIIVDALDECQEANNCRTRFISEISRLQARCGANIFATSRPNGRIEQSFHQAANLEIRATDNDLALYMFDRITLQESDILNPDLTERITNEVIGAADGMFLLAELHMNTLLSLPTRGHINVGLKKLAEGVEGLDETYGQAMERIDGQNRESRELSKKILMWVVFARRPLLISELRYALAVQPDSTELDEDFLPSTDLILSLCGGLVTVDNESGIIRLVHYTTQQYLLRTRDHWSLTPQADITSTCITYLSFDTFGKQMCQTDEQFGILLQLNPFYNYAAQNWGHHFLEVRTQVKGLSPSMLDIFGQDESELQQLQFVTPPAYSALKQDVLTFLESQNHVSNACRHKFHLGSGANWWKSLGFDSDGVPSTTGMHIAAEFGLVDLVLALLAKGHDPCALDSDGRTPLYCAAINGHENTVSLLLARDGGDAACTDWTRHMPIQMVAGKGYTGIVRLFLAQECIDTNVKDWGSMALCSAVSEGHKDVVSLLLAHDKIDVNRVSPMRRKTPLSVAASKGYEAIVRLLLAQKGININRKVDKRNTALSLAVSHGHEAIVNILLAQDDVDVNSKDILGCTPLSRAAETGYERVVKLLLARNDIDVKHRDKNGLSPLSHAASHGHEAVVELLLAHGGFDINAKDIWGNTPLALAAQRGQEAVVRFLLTQTGLEINSRTRENRTPLSLALQWGYMPVVRVLIEAGPVHLDDFLLRKIK